MRKQTIRWIAAVLLLLTMLTFFLPWLRLHLSQENLLAATAQLETAGLTHASRALRDGRLSALETAALALEVAGLLGSEAWQTSALGMMLSAAELARLRFVCFVFVAVLCLSLLLLLIDLLLCICGRFLFGEKRALPLVLTVAAPLVVVLLLSLYLAASRLLPSTLLTLQWGCAAALLCALAAAVFDVWAGLEKRV